MDFITWIEFISDESQKELTPSKTKEFICCNIGICNSFLEPLSPFLWYRF